MYCKNCGNNVADGLANCDVCGADMNADITSYDNNVIDSKPAVDPGKTLGTVSMILGIVAIALGTICSCLLACLGGAIPFICGIIGIILGIVALNKSKAAGYSNKSARIGIILSAVAIVVILIFIILNAVLGGALGAMFSEASSSYSYY